MEHCDWPNCKLWVTWYNANGKACNDHALWLSTINGGHDAIVPVPMKTIAVTRTMTKKDGSSFVMKDGETPLIGDEQ